MSPSNGGDCKGNPFQNAKKAFGFKNYRPICPDGWKMDPFSEDVLVHVFFFFWGECRQ